MVASAPTALWVSEDGTKVYAGARVRRIAQAQDAMSAHELRMYEMLSNQAEQGSARAGYGQLGRALSMDRQNVKHILARLEDKGVLTELEPGRAEDRMPSLYRVHTESEILRRLEGAQRMHYVRSGNGVVFVRPLER